MEGELLKNKQIVGVTDSLRTARELLELYKKDTPNYIFLIAKTLSN